MIHLEDMLKNHWEGETDMRREKIAIIGAGKVGWAMAEALHKAGYEIAGVYSRTLQSAEALAVAVRAKAMRQAVEAATMAKIILLAVPDRSIAEISQEIAVKGGFRKGQVVFHLSGSQDADCLKAVKKAGAWIGSMHPLQTFAASHDAYKAIAGIYFAIDGDNEAVHVAETLVESIGGKSFFIPPKKRAIYHAAACMASNYLVALVQSAVELFQKAGVDREEAIKAIGPLLQTTLDNIQKHGPFQALTGPIVRGDIATVARHLEQIQILSPEQESIYRILGNKALAIAVQHNRLDVKQMADLKKLLDC